jgi:hypothetical protein
MQTPDEILASMKTLTTSLGFSDYCELGMVLVNLVKKGDLSQSDLLKVGMLWVGEITDPEFAATQAKKYGPLVDEKTLRDEIAHLNEAQLMSLRTSVMTWQKVLPLKFKQGMKSLLETLPPLPSGRHTSLNETQKREACERILDLERKKVSRGDAIARVAAVFGTSASTISRAWAERDKLLVKSDGQALDDLN